MSELTIMLTDKCNLSCHFCYNDGVMKDNSKPIKDLDMVLEQHLEECGDRYTQFGITGGEPLMQPKALEEVLSVLLSHSTDKRISINTNACYLTDSMMQTFNQFDNILINVGIDGVSPDRERGLFNLLTNGYKDNYLTISRILRLNRKSIRFVLTRELLKEFNIAFELYVLHKTFNCPIVVMLDQRIEELQKFNLDDVYNLGELIYRLSSLGCYNERGVSIVKMFEGGCQGDCNVGLKWDGTIYQSCTLHSEIGCENFRQSMKPGMYDLIHQFINYKSFTFDESLEDKPRYNPNVGYVDHRYTLDPKRKQLQYEDRIAIRQVT